MIKEHFEITCNNGHINASTTGRLTNCQVCHERITLGWKSEKIRINEMNKAEILQNLFAYFERHNIFYNFGRWCPSENNEKTEVICANWNDTPENLADFIENKLGIDTDWSDEYIICSSCGGFIHTTPGYYGDQRHYAITEYSVLCQSCVEDDPDELIEYLIDNDNHAAPDWAIDIIEKAGFICLDDIRDENSCQIFEAGFHPGQNDTPEKILKQLKDEFNMDISDKYERIWFINSVGQFDIYFSLMLREKEIEDQATTFTVPMQIN